VKRLSEVPVGGRATVERLECERDMRMRLLAMGLVPGTEVQVKSRAPMGDPTNYEVKCYNLSLRREEADCVLIEPVAVYALTAAPAGALRVVEIAGGRGMRRDLARVGIWEDVELRKVQGGIAGPVAVVVGGKMHAVGRGMAQRIRVVVTANEAGSCPDAGTGR